MDAPTIYYQLGDALVLDSHGELPDGAEQLSVEEYQARSVAAREAHTQALLDAIKETP